MNRAVPNDVQLKTAPVLLCKVSLQRIKAKYDLPPSSTGIANLQAANYSYWYPALCIGRFVSNPNDKWQQCVWKPSSCSQSPHNWAPSAGYWGGQCGARKFSVKQMYILGFTCGLPTNTLPLSPLSLHHNPSPQRLTFWDLFGRTAWEQHSFVEGSYIRQNCLDVFNHKIVCEQEESVLYCQHHSIVHQFKVTGLANKDAINFGTTEFL